MFLTWLKPLMEAMNISTDMFSRTQTNICFKQITFAGIHCCLLINFLYYVYRTNYVTVN